MTSDRARNLPASVRQRLLNLARARKEDYNYLLRRYANERLLYRLAQSPYRDQFVLKGATLFELWSAQPHRATRDVDLLGFGSSDISRLHQIFKELCGLDVQPDGLLMLEETVRGEEIREGQEYDGIRIRLIADLDGARIPLQVDVGFGDAVTPGIDETDFPTLLEFTAPHLRVYPRETVVAEKFEAMVDLGMANTRMKDFYDLWELARNFDFDGDVLAKAIAATFERRGTRLPVGTPVALSADFSGDRVKQQQWSAFLRRSGLDPSVALEEVVDLIARFIEGLAPTFATGDRLEKTWSPSGGWEPRR